MPTPDDLARQYLPLVRQLARQHGRGLDPDDAESAGCLALVEALHRLDPTRLDSFASFVSWRVRKRLLDCRRENLARLTGHLDAERDCPDYRGRPEGVLCREFEDALAEIPAEYHELLRLICLAGLGNRAAGKRLSRSAAWVSRQLRELRE